LPFYRDVLGLKVGFERPGFVVLGELGAPALALGTQGPGREPGAAAGAAEDVTLRRKSIEVRPIKELTPPMRRTR
jgi:hypothetical protein